MPAQRALRGEKLSGYKTRMRISNNIINIELNGTPIYDKEGNFISGILCFRDITEKIKNEENLLIKTQYDINMIIIDQIK